MTDAMMGQLMTLMATVSFISQHLETTNHSGFLIFLPQTCRASSLDWLQCWYQPLEADTVHQNAPQTHLVSSSLILHMIHATTNTKGIPEGTESEQRKCV